MLSSLLNPSSPVGLSSSSSISNTIQEVIHGCAPTVAPPSVIPKSTTVPTENLRKRIPYEWPYRIAIGGNCLSRFSMDNGNVGKDNSSTNSCLKVTLLRNGCLTYNLNKGKLIVEMPDLNIYTELLTGSHVRYQRQTSTSGDLAIYSAQPTRNYTHVILIIPDFKPNSVADNIIGNPDALVKIDINAVWITGVEKKNTLSEGFNSEASRTSSALKRPLNNVIPSECSSINQPPPSKDICLQPRQENLLTQKAQTISPPIFNDASNDVNQISKYQPQISLPLPADMNGSYPLAAIPAYHFLSAMNGQTSFIANASPPILQPPIQTQLQPSFRHVRLQVNMTSRCNNSLTTKSLSKYFLSNIFMCVPAFDNVLKYLDLHDRLNCRLVCESWSRLVDSSKCWRKIRVNTSNLGPGRSLNKTTASPYFKRCEKLYLDWECNRKFGGLPISDLHNILSICSSSLRCLWMNLNWNVRTEENDTSTSTTPINLSLDSILMQVPNLEKLGISASCTDVCAVNVVHTNFSNSSVKYLEINHIHQLPNMFLLASRNLHSLQTLHLRSFHLCTSLENMPMQDIHELILDCEGGELQMNNFDWLRSFPKLSSVSIVNVLCNENLIKMIKFMNELQTVVKLSLKEHVPKWALSSNEILANQLPKTLQLLQWDIIVVPSDKNPINTSLSTCMYTDAHFLRCIIQTRLRNDDIDIFVTVNDPSTTS